MLAKQIASFLETEQDFQLHVVLFGYQAAEQFRRIKPDVLILDTQIILPYPFVLEELSQFDWRYRLILLGSNNQGQPSMIPTVHLPYDKVDQDNICSAVRSLTVEYSFSAQNDGILPDQYHILLLLDSSGQDALEQKAGAVVQPYAKYIIRSLQNGALTILVKGSSVAKGTEIQSLAQMLVQYFGTSSVVLYEENVHWSCLEEHQQKLIDEKWSSYFLKGQASCVYALEQIEPIQMQAIQYSLSKLAAASLSGNEGMAERLLRTLYLRVLKQSLDLTACTFVNAMLQHLFRIQSQITGQPCPLVPERGVFIEDDWKTIQGILLQQTQRMMRKRLSAVVTETIAMMFSSYHQDLYLSRAAEQMNLHKGYLSRVFKEQTGLVFTEMLMELRMAAANHYLLHTELKIAQISSLVGYPDANYFGRRYRQVYGISPNQARQRIDQKEQ